MKQCLFLSVIYQYLLLFITHWRNMFFQMAYFYFFFPLMLNFIVDCFALHLKHYSYPSIFLPNKQCCFSEVVFSNPKLTSMCLRVPFKKMPSLRCFQWWMLLWPVQFFIYLLILLLTWMQRPVVIVVICLEDLRKKQTKQK